MFRNLLVVALCSASGIAAAADNGFYVGVGGGESKLKISGALDSKDSNYKVLLGFRALDSFGVEASYQDHGKAQLPTGIACIALVGVNCPSTANVAGKSAAAFAVGFLDFPLVDLFGKAGIASMKTEVRVPALPGFSFNDTSTEFAWGAGLQAHFGSLGARAEFEQFKLSSGDKVDALSVSFLYTFL